MWFLCWIRKIKFLINTFYSQEMLDSKKIEEEINAKKENEGQACL